MNGPKVWVCQVRKEAFVGGESQRCRHNTEWPITRPDQIDVCGEMELIGGEPIEWCVVHGTAQRPETVECWIGYDITIGSGDDLCQFESQVRVGP